MRKNIMRIFRTIGLLLVILGTITCSGSAQEANLKLDQLLEYKNVTVTKVFPSKINFTHSNGAGSLPIAKIPPELLPKLGMTLEAAARWDRKESITKMLKENEKVIHGTVLQALDKGGLLDQVSFDDGFETKKTPYKVQTSMGRAGRAPSRFRPERRPGSPAVKPTYTTRYKETKVPKVSYLPVDRVIFVGPWAGLTDDALVTKKVYPAGTHSYESVGGYKKTVQAYTTDYREFLALKGVILSPGSSAPEKVVKERRAGTTLDLQPAIRFQFDEGSNPWENSGTDRSTLFTKILNPGCIVTNGFLMVTKRNSAQVQSASLPEGNSPFTISMWVMPQTKTQTLVAMKGFWCGIYSGRKKFDSGVKPITLDHHFDFTKKGWYHLVITHDGNRSSLYINGALKLMKPAPNLKLEGPLQVGGNSAEHRKPRVNIDELAIYKRALSETEVTSMYREQVLLSLPAKR